jgi:hypothetical protein
LFFREAMDNDLWPPTFDSILRWGYNEDLEFIEQDEDCVLAYVAHIPALIHLASDNKCPRQDYALSLLKQTTDWIIACGNKQGTGATACAHINAQDLTTDELRSWAADFLQRFSRITESKPFTRAEAEDFARSVIGVPGREFRRTGRQVAGCTEFEAVVPGSTFACYFYVEESTGKWQYWQSADVDSHSGEVRYVSIEEARLRQLLTDR